MKPEDKITTQELTRRRKDDYVDKQKVGLKVVIDLQFYDLMTEKEANSLIKQLGYCHSVNRSSAKCFNYILTSATGISVLTKPNAKSYFQKDTTQISGGSVWNLPL